MEFEHGINIKIMLSEEEEANLNQMTEEAKAMGEVNMTPDRMIEKIIAFAVTQVLAPQTYGCGGGCGSEGGCGGGCGCHDANED